MSEPSLRKGGTAGKHLEFWHNDKARVAATNCKHEIRGRRVSKPFANMPVELVLLTAECLPSKDQRILARTCEDMRRSVEPQELVIGVASWRVGWEKMNEMIIGVRFSDWW